MNVAPKGIGDWNEPSADALAVGIGLECMEELIRGKPYQLSRDWKIVLSKEVSNVSTELYHAIPESVNGNLGGE